MKSRIPLFLASALLVLTTLSVFSPKLKDAYGGRVNVGLFVFMAFAVIPSAVSLIQLHGRRILRRDSNTIYSALTVLAFAVTLIVGFAENQRPPGGTWLKWIVTYWFEPMQQAVFAFLAFFIASAAYRAFRARTLDATLLLIAAVIVMLGNAVLPMPGPGMPGESWLLNVPALAMGRGVILGVALGTIAQSVRILLGIERGFAGRG
ncbi:MAG: hypothetical protein O3A46_08755 [Candidatus Poribacteria bacterium]|nr:hypothetical protein [Candidatus Poribacteria bacterium]